MNHGASRRRIARWSGVGAALTATALLLAACSGADATADPGSTEGGASEGVNDITVLLAPVNYEVAHIADEEGYFKDAGLNVTLQPGGTAQDNLAQLAGGSADISILSWDATVTATAQGVPVTVIASNAEISDEFDTSGVFVRKDSGITDVADLEGKTIAFNSLGSGGNVPVLQALDAAGVDADSVQQVAIPYASMQAALENKQVDAIFPSDSFYAQVSAVDDFTAIAHPSREFRAGLPITLWGVDTAWLDKNPGTAKRFIEAVQKATDFYSDPANEQAVLDIRAEVSQQPVDKVSKTFGPFDTAIDAEVAQSVTEALEKFGLVENPKTVDEILWKDAPRK